MVLYFKCQINLGERVSIYSSLKSTFISPVYYSTSRSVLVWLILLKFPYVKQWNMTFANAFIYRRVIELPDRTRYLWFAPGIFVCHKRLGNFILTFIFNYKIKQITKSDAPNLIG